MVGCSLVSHSVTQVGLTEVDLLLNRSSLAMEIEQLADGLDCTLVTATWMLISSPFNPWTLKGRLTQDAEMTSLVLDFPRRLCTVQW